MNTSVIIQKVKLWIDTIVIGLNLCPFAHAEVSNNRVDYVISSASEPQDILVDIETQLTLLVNSSTIETTLMILPNSLHEFQEYNQFLDLADSLIESMGLLGLIQIASFHPRYQFANTGPNDVENYTNRAPYPILHLLKEKSLERAIALHPDTELIPDKNIELLRNLGLEKVQQMFSKISEKH